MQYRRTPPTRKSAWKTGVVKPRGPHQRLTCAGSVHAFQTRSCGASKMRVMTTPPFAAGPFPFVVVFVGTVTPPKLSSAVERSLPVLSFASSVFLQVFGQSVEAVLPQDAVARQPPESRAERRRIDLAPVHTALGLDDQQAGILEHPEVLRDRRQADIMRLGEFTDGCLTAGELLQDGPPDGVGQRREDGVQVQFARNSINHSVK